MSNIFIDKPWKFDTFPVEKKPWGMFYPTEAAMLFYLARDWYDGFGEIIDAGAFLGSSSYCLAKGLDENPRIKTRSGRLHAFDMFEVWTEFGGTTEDTAAVLRKNFGIEVANGESFLHIYMSNLGDLARHVRAHVGDFLQSKWDGRPIELLFVDICKAPSLLGHTVNTMYRSLIPGHSLVIHQDYHHPLLPWIHVAHERLAEYFEVVEVQADSSIAFPLADKIPDRLIDEVSRLDYSASENVRLIEGAIDRLPDTVKAHTELARAVLLHRLGSTNEARAAIDVVRAMHPQPDELLKQNFVAALWATRAEMS